MPTTFILSLLADGEIRWYLSVIGTAGRRVARQHYVVNENAEAWPCFCRGQLANVVFLGYTPQQLEGTTIECTTIWFLVPKTVTCSWLEVDRPVPRFLHCSRNWAGRCTSSKRIHIRGSISVNHCCRHLFRCCG